MKRLTKSERESVRTMFSGRCAYCGDLLGERWHVDHVEPVERKLAFTVDRRIVCTDEAHKPERDTIENMMPACVPCNIDKWVLTLEAWRSKLQDACGVLKRNQPTYRHAVRFGLVMETGAVVSFYFERVAAQPGSGDA